MVFILRNKCLLIRHDHGPALLALFMAFLFLVPSLSFASCYERKVGCGAVGNFRCGFDCPQHPNASDKPACVASDFVDYCYPSIVSSFHPTSNGCSDESSGCGYIASRLSYYVTCCSNQVEADSVACVSSGKHWQNGQCQEPLDPHMCDADKAECERVHGEWNGEPTSEGCRSSCNLCNTNAQNAKRNFWINSCCNLADREAAPPTDINGCFPVDIAQGVGMSFSVFTCKGTGDCACREVGYDETAGDDYANYCLLGERFDENQEEEPGANPQDTSAAKVPGDSTEGENGGDWEYNYYPVIDTIRDSLIKIKRDINDIANCLLTGTCLPGSDESASGDTTIVNVEGDTIIVNVPGDSAILNDIRDLIGNIDPTDYALRDSTGKVAADVRGVDASVHRLMDSSIKYLNAVGDSLGKAIAGINDVAGALDSAFGGMGTGSGEALDTSSAYDGVSGDSARYALVIDSMLSLGGADGISVDSAYKMGATDSCSTDECLDLLVDTKQNAVEDSLVDIIQFSIDSSYDTLETTLEAYFDTLRNDFQLVNFDSLILQPLGTRLPNTNTCPEDCFSIDMSGAGGAFANVKGLSWGLCTRWLALGNNDVLYFLRIVFRIICAFTCVYIGMWFIAGRK